MIKQVIIIRKDLNCRRGKEIAQGCHASIEAYLRADETTIKLWNATGHTKICVGCNSKEELYSLYQAAQKWKLPCSLIVDSGRTEFNGVPTATAVAIGPGNSELIDKITGELKLL